MKTKPLQYNAYYHIYNRGINGCSVLFRENDYEHFLRLYDKYISTIAETFAWVLMGNHFHFWVLIKANVGYKYSNADGSIDAARFEEVKWQTQDLSACEAPGSVKIPKPEMHFSHLFNSYAKYFNKVHKRSGALFESPFKRVIPENLDHLRYLVYYIHHNPVHHRFCEEMIEYPWSSYQTILSPKQTKLKRVEVVKWYSDARNFCRYHSESQLAKFHKLHIDLPIIDIPKPDSVR